MLRNFGPVCDKHMLDSDSETELESDSETESDDYLKGRNNVAVVLKKGNEKGSRIDEGKKLLLAGEANNEVAKPSKTTVDQDALVEIAKEYQKYMKKMAIPKARLSEAVVVNWVGLAKTLKELYGQPLHYLTYMLCKQWDQSRFGSDDEWKPLDAILKWRNAETIIWNVEEVHRLCTSPVHLAMVWVSDPEYHAFVDEVIP